MRMEVEKETEALSESLNTIFKFLKMMKREEKDVEGGKCIRDVNGRLNVNDIDTKRIWRQHMEKIMNEENDWDQIINVDVVLGPVVQRVARVQIIML